MIADLDGLLARLVEMDGTDLFLNTQSPPVVSVAGRLRRLGRELLDEQTIFALLTPLLTGDRSAAFLERPDLDLAYVAPGIGRFRVNIYRERGEIAAVARRIKLEVPTIDRLGLPRVLRAFARLQHGLVVVTGRTGSGKSTTLAAMIDHRNETMEGHIVTIEDPIEFIHPHKRSLVSQREIGTDTASFEDAVRSALRQAPDAVLLGEIRDRETAETALHMSETGHLVLATLHAQNAAQVLSRLRGLFPESLREQVQLLLSIELGGVIAQRLLPRRDGRGRVAAIEILVPTPRIRHLISRGDLDGIRDAMAEAHGADAMQTFEDALARLTVAGEIAVDVALAHADSPADLKLRLRQEARRREEATGARAPVVPGPSAGAARAGKPPRRRRPLPKPGRGADEGGIRIL